MSQSPIERFGPVVLSLSTPVIWGVVAYFAVPIIFGGQSKTVQYTLMVAIPLVMWFNTYRTMKGVHSQTMKNKATALAKVAEAKEIVKGGPETPGYAAAQKILTYGVSY